jgi:hypothetical protein
MQRGFTIKEGQDDLKDYVYEAANDLIRARDEEARALLADGGKGEAQPIDILLDRLKSGGDYTTPLTTPQAECAPREAQPIYQYSSGYGWVDCSESDYEKMQNPKWRRIVYAAPTPERADLSPEARAFYARHETRMGRCGPVAPERADADTAGANPGWLHVDEVKALCRDFSSRTGNVYIKDVESALDGLAALPSADPTYPASERADAGKDAARYRWILENADVLFKRAEFFNGIYSHYPATHEVSEAIDAAILAANKEPK